MNLSIEQSLTAFGLDHVPEEDKPEILNMVMDVFTDRLFNRILETASPEAKEYLYSLGETEITEEELMKVIPDLAQIVQEEVEKLRVDFQQ